jgi:hypothetical protein
MTSADLRRNIQAKRSPRLQVPATHSRFKANIKYLGRGDALRPEDLTPASISSNVLNAKQFLEIAHSLIR